MKSVILPPLTVLTTATVARIEGPSFTALVSGSVRTVLSGTAVFGPVRNSTSTSGSFSLTLGAYSDNGAVASGTFSASPSAPAVPLTLKQ